MDLEQNHADIAWGHFTGQFQKSPRLESFVKSLYQPIGPEMLLTVFNDRWLDTAEGAQLDGIGQIVGMPRKIDNTFLIKFFGFNSQPNSGTFGEARLRREGEATMGGSAVLMDPEYRKILYWKIAVNNGRGTAPEIAAAVKAIFDATWCSIVDAGNAKIQIVFNVTPNTNPAFLVTPLMWIPKAAGIGVELLITDEEKPFGFRHQNLYGFGEGVILQGFTTYG